jgi:hypothetical protein
LKALRPDFTLPEREVILAASVDHVVKYIAKNVAASEVVLALVTESAARGLEPPTVMMLDMALEYHRIPVRRVPFADLGIQGKIIRPDGSEPS